MRLLLDTHTFIWWANTPEYLSPKVFSLLQDYKNQLFLSTVCVWEIQIKLQIGKIEFRTPLKKLIESQVLENQLKILPVNLEHVLNLTELHLHHKDPFDRLLISQAQIENMHLVSKDTIFSSYPVDLIW